MPVTAESPANESHQTVEATRQARSRSPFVSSSLKIGTKAAPSAASATSERIRLGIWYATVKALIASPCTVKIHAAAASRSMPTRRLAPVATANSAVETAMRRRSGASGAAPVRGGRLTAPQDRRAASRADAVRPLRLRGCR